MSSVYFIRCIGSGAIKIGYAKSVAKRMAQLSCGPHPIELIAAIPGARPLEARLHRALRGHRQRFEWFKPTAEVRAAALVAKHKGLSAILRWLDRVEFAELERCDAIPPATDDLSADLKRLSGFAIKVAVERHGWPAVCTALDKSRDFLSQVRDGQSELRISTFLRLAVFDLHAVAPAFARVNVMLESTEQASDLLSELQCEIAARLARQPVKLAAVE